MKFLADMGIALRTVAWLRQDGYDIVHLRDEGLQYLDNTDILVKARQEERIVLMSNKHFRNFIVHIFPRKFGRTQNFNLRGLLNWHFAG